ncbi:MAG: hypothetical protein ACKVS6_16830 [Planctomycetota bacterium]
MLKINAPEIGPPVSVTTRPLAVFGSTALFVSSVTVRELGADSEERFGAKVIVASGDVLAGREVGAGSALSIIQTAIVIIIAINNINKPTLAQFLCTFESDCEECCCALCGDIKYPARAVVLGEY